MSPNQCMPVAAQHQRVLPVLCGDLESALLRKIAQVHAAFDLAADDVAVNLVAQILVRREHPTLVDHDPSILRFPLRAMLEACAPSLYAFRSPHYCAPMSEPKK